ncbi:DNA glycosylase [Macrolepiota fuliginosa MF-IS2]|uniref:DNA glycosylase n=1 Tax=Macrolepiota fuliginosa MF-IS2 TaxID=1400762 RepID=A0A9P5XBZ5_9AGAR|nr:DNA glycosylase [Macrolepiota fuliginosa MF-IS2]
MSTPDEDESVSQESTSTLFKKTLASFSFQPKTPPSTRTQRNESTKPSTSTSTPEPRRSLRSPLSHTILPETPSRKHAPASVKSKRGFAPPERYAHLNTIQDCLEPNLDIVFCGINPGQKSAEVGHHYGGPTNHFWPCLYESGLTPERLQPTDDFTLPERFSIGMTNLVDRPTAEQNELSRAERLAAVPAFLNKIARYRPRTVCFVGLGITEIVKSQVLPKSSNKGKENNKISSYGLQPFKLVYDTSETLFFAVASTSGRVVHYQKTHKVEQFKELKILIEQIKTGVFDSTGLVVIQR